MYKSSLFISKYQLHLRPSLPDWDPSWSLEAGVFHRLRLFLLIRLSFSPVATRGTASEKHFFHWLQYESMATCWFSFWLSKVSLSLVGWCVFLLFAVVFVYIPATVIKVSLKARVHSRQKLFSACTLVEQLHWHELASYWTLGSWPGWTVPTVPSVSECFMWD